MIDNTTLEYALRLVISMICGFLLGFERKTHQNPVGIRTLVLISISCCSLSILSVYMSELGISERGGDPTRIASTAVTGIGFIGGGAILKQGLNIRGLTTAAIILTAATLGLCCGAGLYEPVAITLLITLIILFIMNKLEKILFPASKTKILQLKLDSLNVNESKISAILKNSGIIISDVNIEYTIKKEQTVLTYTVNTPRSLDTQNLIENLTKCEKLINFTLFDKI